MYHRIVFTLGLSLASVSQASSLVRRDCESFQLVGSEDGYESQYPDAFRATPTADCRNSSEQCELEPNTYITVHPQINITDVSDADVETIMDLVQAATVGCGNDLLDFNNTIVTHLQGVMNAVPSGMTGLLMFRPTMRCWEGILSGCDDGPIVDNTPVEACAIQLLNANDGDIRPVRGEQYIFTDLDGAILAGPSSDPPEQLSSTRPCGEGVSVDEETETAEVEEDAAIGLRENLSTGFVWVAGLGWLVIALVY